MKTQIIDGLRTQTADAGKTLTNGESYSKIVYLGNEAPEWNEILDSEVPQVEEIVQPENKTVN